MTEKCLSENSLYIEILSGLTIDGAHATIGKNKGAVKLLTDKLDCKGIKTNDIYII